MKIFFTEHSGQARIFAKRKTASKWAKAAKAKVIPIDGRFVVHCNERGWLK